MYRYIAIHLYLNLLSGRIVKQTLIKREHHNLDRARNQFKLVKDIEKLEDELLELVKTL